MVKLNNIKEMPESTPDFALTLSDPCGIIDDIWNTFEPRGREGRKDGDRQRVYFIVFLAYLAPSR